jgi:type VI secretion system secreted protein VgrG
MPVRDLPAQTNRVLRIDTPAKPNSFLLVGLTGEDMVNGLFRFTLDLVSDKDDIAADDLMGSAVSFGVIEGLAPKPGQQPRWFNGIVSRFGGGLVAGQDLYSYRMEVVPKLWLATLKKRSRTFENKTPSDIINQVLGEYGIRPSIKGTLDATVQKIVTQFQETDFSLLTRVIELAGGAWYHTHAEGAHTLVIGAGTAAFTALEGEGDPNQWLEDVSAATGFVPKKVVVHDWDMQQKSALVGQGQAKNAPSQAASLFENEYLVGQGGEETRVPLEKVAARRLEAAEWQAALVRAASTTPRFGPGLKFPASESTPKINGQTAPGYVITSVRHGASDQTFITDGGYSSYRNDVQMAPDTLPLTAVGADKPRIYGLHLALVTDGWGEGAGGDPLKLARVRIKYMWGPDNGTDAQSAWARVSQQWVGRNWGSVWSPPVDTEVLIGFIDGDPDRPMVVGCLYNGVDKIAPPIGDDHATTRNGVVTKSGHEFWFDDKSGDEKIRLFSSKDLDVEVKNNQVVLVHTDDTQTVKGKRTEEVVGNFDTKVSQGNMSTKISAGSQATEAAQKIELKVGGNSIVIDQSGITIKGIMVKIDASAMFEAKSPMSTVKGDGMLTLKGGIVLIN